jgi:hypothetical protein
MEGFEPHANDRREEPEHHGFLHRWLSFSWRHCFRVGIVAAGIFLFVYRNQLMR